MKPYLDNLLSRVTEVVSRVDREFFSPTYGCGDRLYWCWKFTDFPGARFQECVYTLAWLYRADGFDNPWRGNGKLLEAASASLDYWSRIQYPDGSFDEAYPWERSLAATAFCSFYLSEGYGLIESELAPAVRERFLAALSRAGHWLCRNDERHGVLSNHLAAAAGGLWNAAGLLNDDRLRCRAESFVGRILENQSEEGWYREYGGADPGYQTHATFYLARIWQKSGDSRLLESLRKANGFLRYFVNPDGSVGGEYASRNTAFYYPAGYEMLAGACPHAASIAVAQREKVSERDTVGLEQMDAQNLYPVLNNYIFAYEAWLARGEAGDAVVEPLPWQTECTRVFRDAGLVVRGTADYYAVVGASKGGVLRVWGKPSGVLVFQSSGYVAEWGGRWVSSQGQGSSSFVVDGDRLTVQAGFTAVSSRVFTPWSFVGFRLFMLTVGRFAVAAGWMKRLLVKVLVSRRRGCPMVLSRTVEWGRDGLELRDRIDGGRCVVRHVDKFSSIHMGSSRYIHGGEERVRGQGYPAAVLEFGSRGVLQRGVVRCAGGAESGSDAVRSGGGVSWS